MWDKINKISDLKSFNNKQKKANVMHKDSSLTEEEITNIKLKLQNEIEDKLQDLDCYLLMTNIDSKLVVMAKGETISLKYLIQLIDQLKNIIDNINDENE